MARRIPCCRVDNICQRKYFENTFHPINTSCHQNEYIRHATTP